MTKSDPIDSDNAWSAVTRRDRSADGSFVFGVQTTGVYCRPSCAARRPKRANVRFFADVAAARQAGLRACLRCRPDDVARDDAAVTEALRMIEAAEGVRVGLAQLASAVGYSQSHFQRLFKARMGMSPAIFTRLLRARCAGTGLTEAASVTDAIYAAGYESPSRFYADMKEELAMTPSAWVHGGRGVTIRWAVVATRLGDMLLAATDRGICRLSFGEGGDALVQRFPNAVLDTPDAAFQQLVAEVKAVLDDPALPVEHLPLDIAGTPFQRAIWQALRAIPLGETRSYAQIAAAAGRPGAVRAAGSANGANPVAVLIPCHRVIRSDSTLGGYAYGLAIKQALLDGERAR